MSSYLRPRIPGATIFFTVALAKRGDDLLIREVDLLRKAVAKTHRERPFHIDAWVVLPDHMHCVWTLPEDDTEYATRWRLIKSRFSMVLPQGHRRPSHMRRGERGLWQRRFWEHHVRNGQELEAYVRYCWENPIKHGLVDAPEDWPYSSFHMTCSPEKSPVWG